MLLQYGKGLAEAPGALSEFLVAPDFIAQLPDSNPLSCALRLHSRQQSLMEPARAALESALASVKICAPQIPVWSNVTASPFPSDPDSIRKLLGRQLVEPVRWEATLVALTSPDDVNNAGTEGGRKLHELGPGQQIKSMVRRVSGDAWKAMVNASAS